MKKYFLTLSVMALFAIGFASSDEDESSNSSSSEPQTEQKQETEAERKAREQKKERERQAREAERAEAKKKKVAEAGYKRGYEKGIEGSRLLPNVVNIYYTNKFGAPSNSEEKELFEIYKQNFEKGYEEGRNAR